MTQKGSTYLYPSRDFYIVPCPNLGSLHLGNINLKFPQGYISKNLAHWVTIDFIFFMLITVVISTHFHLVPIILGLGCYVIDDVIM